MNMKVKPLKTKFFANKPSFVIVIFGYLFFLSIWISVFVVFLKGGNEANTKQEMSWVFALVTIVFLVLIIGPLVSRKNCFYIIEVTESTIKRSLFNRFRKIEIKWEDVKEIKCYKGVEDVWFLPEPKKPKTVLLTISKTVQSKNSITNAHKRKDTICIYDCDIKKLNLIRKYTQQELKDLPPWLEEKLHDMD